MWAAMGSSSHLRFKKFGVERLLAGGRKAIQRQTTRCSAVLIPWNRAWSAPISTKSPHFRSALEED